MGHWMQAGMKNPQLCYKYVVNTSYRKVDEISSQLYPISRFISEMIQDRAIVTVEGEMKPYLSFQMVPLSFSDLQWPLTHILQGHDIIHYSASNIYKKNYTRYICSYSARLLVSQDHAIIWHWISLKQYEMETYTMDYKNVPLNIRYGL